MFSKTLLGCTVITGVKMLFDCLFHISKVFCLLFFLTINMSKVYLKWIHLFCSTLFLMFPGTRLCKNTKWPIEVFKR